jgi:glyoxylase-like metal-dependent hydrolase (beta-lactamase superfamily II)
MAKGPVPIKLYVFNMGTLRDANPKPLLDAGVQTTDMSVESYLIVHPRGTVIFDTGVIPDELVKPEGTIDGRATSHKTLTGQLAEIGYKPSDITYLVLSHSHSDHTANANEFAAKSTWIVQKPERDLMFPANPPVAQSGAAAPAAGYGLSLGVPVGSLLKNSKTKLLNGEDYDVFGDGTVMIMFTPGHTPGHQCLVVKLPKTGTVVLTGDLFHYPIEQNQPDFSMYGRPTSDQEVASRKRIIQFAKDQNAQIWILHDIIRDIELKKSPQYYD